MKNNELTPSELLYALNQKDSYDQNIGLIHAVAQCLSIEDAIKIILNEASSVSPLRNCVLKRLAKENADQNSEKFDALVIELTKQIQFADARARQGIGFCISSLFYHLTPATKRTVIEAFLTARSIVLRRRGYKLWDESLALSDDLLFQVWERNNDVECADLMIKILPAEILLDRRIQLLEILSEPWKVSRLYLKIGEINGEVLEELAPIDGISYCYVNAKLGKQVPDTVLQSIFTKYQHDERIGLLVWSIGKLKSIATLRWIYNHLSEIHTERFEHMKRKYSMHSKQIESDYIIVD